MYRASQLHRGVDLEIDRRRRARAYTSACCRRLIDEPAIRCGFYLKGAEKSIVASLFPSFFVLSKGTTHPRAAPKIKGQFKETNRLV